MLKNWIVLCVIVNQTMLCWNTALAYSLHNDQFIEKSNDAYSDWMDIGSIYNKYKNYTNSDISVFLKLKLLSSLNSMAKGDIDFGNGVRFIKDYSIIKNDSGSEFSENAILESIPRTIGGSEDYLSGKLWKRVNELMRSHTIQVSITKVRRLIHHAQASKSSSFGIFVNTM